MEALLEHSGRCPSSCLQFWTIRHIRSVPRITQLTAFVGRQEIKDSIQPDEEMCADESMIRAYHKKLAGKLGVQRKPQSIGMGFKLRIPM